MKRLMTSVVGLMMLLTVVAAEATQVHAEQRTGCDPNDQWPIFAHDFARTSQSGLQLGDVCGVISAWVYTGNNPTNSTIDFTAPLIVGDKVYVSFASRIVCLNLQTGVEIWNTKVAPLDAQYGALVGGMRELPTIEGDYIYFGTGSTRGMIKADRHTGNVTWVRSTVTGGPLPGTPGSVVYGTSAVIGNGLYFGNNAGTFYALDKTTGANLYFMQLYADLAHTQGVGVLAGPSSDGTNLFVGTYGALSTSGTIYSLTPGIDSFTVNWVYVIPPEILAILPGGFFSAPSFRGNNLFINSYSPVMYNGYRGFRQNLDPATGIPKWPTNELMGHSWSAPPATAANGLAYFANKNGGYSGDPASRGITCVDTANNVIWRNVGTPGTYDNNLFLHATVTCDAYVIYGTYNQSAGDSHWRIADGNTGNILVDYFMPGSFVEGTAIAHGSDGLDWMVASSRNTAYTGGPGKLFAFIIGGPRPRMQVPKTYVVFDPINADDALSVQVSEIQAVKNTGCQPLNITCTLAAGNPPLALRPVLASPGLLTPPTWVSWVSPDSGASEVGAGSSLDFTFQLDPSQMQSGDNYFSVQINSNDPDYNPENPTANPQAVIEYHILRDSPPVISPLTDLTKYEGDTVSFRVTATDPDSTVPTLTGVSLPSGASFVDSGNGSGCLSWVIPFKLYGTVNVTFVASDSVFADTEAVTINVQPRLPMAVSLIAPANALAPQLTLLRPTFIWSASPGPDPNDTVTYDIMAAMDSNFAFAVQIPNLADTSYTMTIDLQWSSRYWWKIKVTDLIGGETWSPQVYTFRTLTFGDANGDASVDISDAVYLISYIFAGGAAPNPLMAGDANCDGSVDISDAVYLIAYIFSGGPAPCENFK